MAGRTRRPASTGPRSVRVLVLSLVCLSVLLVAVSPLALDLFDGSADSWTRRGNIGQTYGAAAALLSVFALAGVAASLVLQARESKANREQASRLRGAAHTFQATPGRRFWADTRALRIDTSETRRARRFHQILDEEYLKAIAPGPSSRPDTR